MNLIPNIISSKLSRHALVAQKHSPAILFGVGIVGVATATVLACRATLKMDDILTEAQEEIARTNEALALEHPDYGPAEHRNDLGLIYLKTGLSIVKVYGPAFVLGVTAIAALVGSHHILNKRNAALMSAYAAVEKGFAKYRERVAELVGAEKEEELRYGVEVCEIEDENGKKTTEKVAGPIDGYSVYARFFDEYSPSWNKTPEYNRVFLQCQQNYLNDLLRSRGHVFLNEAYDALGIERSTAGAVVGWVLSDEGDNFVDFGIFDGDKERARSFVNGREGSILLDFNVDGVIYDKI